MSTTPLISPRASRSLTVALLFVILAVVFTTAIVAAQLFFGVFDQLMRLDTQITAGAGRALGVQMTTGQTTLFLKNHTLEVDLDCTALFLVGLFAALVLAYPLSARAKVVGLLVGAAGILLANLVRLVGVVLVSQYAPDSFTFVHDFVFQASMILVVVALWVWWLSWVRAHA